MRIPARFAILVLFATSLVASDPPKRAIALTFDDLPFADTGTGSSPSEVQEVNRQLLAILRKHRAPAIGFVNEKKVEASDRERRIAALNLWLQDGQKLGNHTYSHPDFNKLTLAEFIADTERGETVLKQMLSSHKQSLVYFRFPFNHAGNDAAKKNGFEEWLLEHHYELATCTVENSDWIFNRAYTVALNAGDNEKAKLIRANYLEFTDAKLRFFEKASQDIAGREFPQVLLMHDNRLNADALDELLTRMERHGYKFVTLEEAQSDPIYRTPESYVGEYGPIWLYRWAPALKKKIDGSSEPEPPKWIVDMTQ